MANLLTELWAWYGLTVVVVGARLLSRRMLFKSFKALQADDWLMLFLMCAYTALLGVIHILSYTPTNLVKPGDNIVLTPEDIKKREYGSKLVLVTEHLQMIVIWSVKGCLLMLYSRLTMSLRQHIFVKFVAWYVVLSFILMEILWFIWCRPFHFYWKVPAPNMNCSAETNHMITNTVFNLSTDVMIIALPMPVLIGSQLPWKRKLTLCCVFALGIFTILAAILSKYYSLGTPYGAEWIYWYIREVSTAIIAANLPLTWTLLQRIFGMSNFHSRNKSSDPRSGKMTRQSKYRSTYGNLTSRTKDTGDRIPKDPHPIDISPSESQEQINGENDYPLKIWHQREVQITSEEVDANDHSSLSDKSEKSIPVASSADPQVRNGDMGIVTNVSHAM
ncbi:hypothetical protein P171DRAFT_470702 [Karstenula rhodostoma CBS 690.94]|uniref:Rhodopsin domain-containing protein n=1 Tax=Karstenula rhodostoma CBS 690.94 TaxID=1392251 RepID=A0A9P4PLQ9_9PLEO|nr:hypothetical protein P171DRAFT_470702 [Karstenula rhodostoma CBS 690.94]